MTHNLNYIGTKLHVYVRISLNKYFCFTNVNILSYISLHITFSLNGIKQRHFRQSYRSPSNDGLYAAFRYLFSNWPTYSWVVLMENNTKRNIDPQKITAEKLNGRFALLGVIALVGAYVTTGQIIPGIV